MSAITTRQVQVHVHVNVTFKSFECQPLRLLACTVGVYTYIVYIVCMYRKYMYIQIYMYI